MTAILLVPPISEPVSLAEAKTWLRVDTSSEDDAIAALIAAAGTLLEAETGRVLVTQTWRFVRDAWPDSVMASPCTTAPCCMSALTLPLAPIAGIVAVRVYDLAGNAQSVSASTYQLLTAPDMPRILFSATPAAPGRAVAGIEIDVLAGYGAPADVPQPLRQAILMLVARLYENRGDGALPADLRGAAAALIAPFRRVRVA